jgi:CRP-like cAMP-binding protein
LGIFEGTSPQQLEALAATLSEESVSAGTIVIREDDEPDDLFAVVTGSMEVLTGTGCRGTRRRHAGGG